MKILTKIKEIHNKFIQKLDTPDNIDIIIHLFPLVVFYVPGVIGVLLGEAMQISNDQKDILYILSAFTVVAGFGYAIIHNARNVEKEKKYCICFIIITVIICYGTFFAIFFQHLLFH